MAEPVLSATDLTVASERGTVVDHAVIALAPGEIVGLTGPSGAGKSTLALALLGLARPPLAITAGSVRIGGRDLIGVPEPEAQAIRGRDVALVLQNPRGGFHPMLTVGRQIGRIWQAHHRGSTAEAERRAVEMLGSVGINDAQRRAEGYVHEFSGGMAQRALIAAALSANPSLLIADEPTSGLDVTIQAAFLDRMWTAARERDMAMLLVTQEPGILANYCDRVLEMEGGRIVRDRPVRAFFAGHAASSASEAAPLAQDAPVLLSVDGLSKYFPHRGGGLVKAVDQVSLDLRRGETLGLVGESGSGKTTVGRCLLRLIEPSAGAIGFDGTDLATMPPGGLRKLRARIQLVRQDPFDSFDPRWTMARSIEEPLIAAGDKDASRRRTRVEDALKLVGAGSAEAGAKPRDLPAGTLQRLAIARALVTRPDFVVLDEPTSVLTPDARRELVALLGQVQAETGVAFLFISHDLTTVASVCHRVAVMYLGQIVEIGTTRQIFDHPRHPYTRALIDAHLGEDPDARRAESPRAAGLQGDVPSPIDLPAGCYLAGRCPHAEARCRTTSQDLIRLDDGRFARCWRAAEQVDTLGSPA